MENFFPMDPKELSQDQLVKAVGYLMFLEEERDGKLKGRYCANGNNHHSFTNK